MTNDETDANDEKGRRYRITHEMKMAGIVQTPTRADRGLVKATACRWNALRSTA